MKNFIRSFISFVIVLTTLFIELDASIRMGIVTDVRYVGDREVAWRIKIAAERLGWTVFLDEKEGRLIKKEQLDWSVCMLPKNKFSVPHCPNYLMVFHPFNYLDDERKFLPFYEKYDGYLLTINDRESLENGLKLKNKEFHYIPFYPTLQSVPYMNVPLNNLMVMVAVWGNRLNELKYKTLYTLLSQSGIARFYGISPHASMIPQGYMGPIPFDGVSVINVLQENGIILVLHSDIHNEEGIPSSRIFEAAASSAVIISDENAFVKKHFGDSVFYIDTTLSAENIFAQIMDHWTTIHQDPERALEMAKKAHEIFTENFTMEDQLLTLEAMHQEIMNRGGI